ncbi:hypothetical protein GCE86_14780 [Micromonospora terminaliae]|uniref:Glycosyltransferase RgtA/B/C/D-like domain-containing protein n=1 Tax=Micromonospora terminaliae TaxID=1914461 RepID=A0AAJ3DIE5_9ACTN|nr:hypothetical protein [Micromonospora terminaliae]NES27048.1 hypothetical protein [Micromonospora terminaliae]QGL48179.1 hypothetical protein GCE86_14780 [Micromonospora terminaliae]
MPTRAADGPPVAARDDHSPAPAGPTRGRRGRWRGWGWLRHEWTVATVAALLLAVVLTWPTMRHPASTVPGDLGDPTLQAWQVAWSGHALLTHPLALWNSNTFYPETYTFAYSDTLLGYAPMGALGAGFEAALVRYNVMYVLVHALAFVGAYALVRQLGAGRWGGAVAGVAWAYAPWRLAHAGHLNILSSGGIALSLAMLARGHGWSLRHGYRPERRRPGWALGGWLVAAWQVTLGFGIGLPLVYFLLAAVLVAAGGYGWSWWRRRERVPFGRRLLLADLAGGLAFGAVTLLLGLVYLRVVDLNPQAVRSLDWTEMFSPPLIGFVTAPADSWLWGEPHAAAREQLSWPPEMALLPGMALIGMAMAGLFVSVYPVRQRVALGLGVLATVLLGLGATLGGDGDPGYLTLSRHLPGWDALRTPGRMMHWTSLLLAVLAAGLVTTIAEPARRPPTRRWTRLLAPAALLVPLALVGLEGVNRTPHPVVPRPPAALRTAEEPVLLLPIGGTNDLHYMLWTTDGFPRVANGLAGFEPASQAQTRAAAATFPDPTSVAYLRGIGVRSVVALPGRAVGTPWEGIAARPVDGLGITREELDGVLVYHLG